MFGTLAGESIGSKTKETVSCRRKMRARCGREVCANRLSRQTKVWIVCASCEIVVVLRYFRPSDYMQGIVRHGVIYLVHGVIECACKWRGR